MSSETTEHRTYSVIQRRMIDGRGVFVKQCLPAGYYNTSELVRSQLAREVEIVSRLASLPGFTRGLGVVKIVEHDLARKEISTEEVPGESLQGVLGFGRPKILRGTCVRALYRAGKWLRIFQTLPLDPRTTTASPGNPPDLVAHCELRLETLRELGYHWPSATARRQLLQWLRRQVEATPKEYLQAVWCHGDYGPYNMIWDGRVLTPIDFTGHGPGLPLTDLTHLIHRLEMLSIQLPWRRWPIALWRKACLRGYGLPHAERLPIYPALLVRHLLSRLKKSLQAKCTTQPQHWHNLWCRNRVQAKLERLVGR